MIFTCVTLFLMRKAAIIFISDEEAKMMASRLLLRPIRGVIAGAYY